MTRAIAIEVVALFGISMAGLLLCCKPGDAPTPTPPVVDASVETACAHLSTMGCAGFDAGGCAAGLANLLNVGAAVDLPCITNAPNKQVVAGCAGIGTGGCP